MGANAEQVRESLVVLAQVMQNDLDSVRMRLDPPSAGQSVDEELRSLANSQVAQSLLSS